MGKVKERDHAADHLAHRGGDGCACKLVLLRQEDDEQLNLRLLGCYEETLKYELQYVERQRRQYDPRIDHAVFEQRALRAQQNGDRTDKNDARCRKDYAQSRGEINKEREISVRPCRISLTKCF